MPEGPYWPMLAAKANAPLTSLVGTHVFDTKLDGVRMMAFWDGATLTLRNRSGRDCTTSWPELTITAPTVLKGPTILDGEVIIPGGRFQDVARRDKATKAKVAATLATQMPATFVAFDILQSEGVDVRSQPFSWRRQLLELTLPTDSVTWATTALSPDPAIYDTIRSLGGEGVIAKRLSGRYAGGRSRSWIKYKATNSVTCVGVGYEPGSGSRAAFGAMRLAMVDLQGGSTSSAASALASPTGRLPP